MELQGIPADSNPETQESDLARHPVPADGRSKMGEVFGICDNDLAVKVVVDVAQTTGEKDNGAAITNALSLLKAFAPNDPLQAMLAAQMAACHNLTMQTMRRAQSATDPRRIASYVDQASKCARTFVTQIETLGRLRNRGQQRVVVEHQHVTVQAGGQAVVGVVQDLKKTGGG